MEAAGTLSYVEADGKYMGYVRIGDAPKAHAKEAIQGLRRAGVSHTVLLTGDRKASGEALARELGIDDARCELLPGDKVTALESIMKERPGQVVRYQRCPRAGPRRRRCGHGCFGRRCCH